MFQALRNGLLSLVAAASATVMAPQAGAQPIELRIIGGLASVHQYQSLEEPFWTQELKQLTSGRVKAVIHPFDHSGLRGQDMLHLIRLGVVPFGTALIPLVAGDEPEISSVDLPGISPDMATLRRNVAAYRPVLATILKERYGVELLGVYAYPAQVLFCRQPFAGLGDLKGRRIRTSSIGQSEMMSALGAMPVVTAFAEIMPAINRGAVDCAITGTLSGNEIGLSEATSHMHAMSMGWGLAVFGANETAWNAVPADIRGVVKEGIGRLEGRIWEGADRDTQAGFDCNTGLSSCTKGKRGRMSLIRASAADEAILRRVLEEAVIPGWVKRCGARCVDTWNATLGEATGIRLEGRKAEAAPALPAAIR
jgi:TRAP-type C4-dicarboxylate transport system substrate-binding protein